MTSTKDAPSTVATDIRVALIANANSLSGLCQLEYHIGYLAGDKGCIYIRLWKNSGNGKFPRDWLALADIEKVLAKVPAEEAFTGAAFAPLFAGRSVNGRYFALACMLHAGLLRRTEDGYVRDTPTEWWTKLQGAIDASKNLPVESMGQVAGDMAEPTAKKSTKKSKPTAAIAPTTAAES